jgi:hypothetical protein
MPMTPEDCSQTADDIIPHLPPRLPVEMSDTELLEYVELVSDARAVPPCRVCGGVLSVVRIGGGKSTEWACPVASRASSEATRMDARRVADAHYRDSRWSQYRDELNYARELARRFRTRLATLPRNSVTGPDSDE